MTQLNNFVFVFSWMHDRLNSLGLHHYWANLEDRQQEAYNAMASLFSVG